MRDQELVTSAQLKKLQIDLRMTNKQLGDKIGMSPTMVDSMRHGRRKITLRTSRQLQAMMAAHELGIAQ